MADTNRYEIPWDESLNTGIRWIDEQHKQLLKCIEDMLNALIEKKCQENVKPLVTFLSDYVHTHFNTEQSHMIRYNYPKFLIHKVQHMEFSIKLKEMEKQYALSGSSRELAMEIEKELWGWYKTHICKFDKDFSKFLQDNRASDNLD